MSFVNQYRSTTIYGELKVQRFNTGNIAGLLDISGNTILRGDCIINGNLSATDGTIDISGNLNVSDTISGSLSINDTNNTDDSFRVPFLDNETSSSTFSSSAGLKYNPVSEVLNYTTLNGGDIYALDISCNNVNAANFIGNVSTTTEDASNVSFFPTFVSAEGNAPLKVNSGFAYNPFTETLNVTNINGTILNNATTSTIATDSSNQSFFPTFVSATSGNLRLKTDSGITYNPFLNILSCDVSGNLTGNVSGTATNINITSSNAATAFRIPFASTGTGSSTLLSDSNLTFTPSNNTLSVSKITADITGDLTGTSSNINITETTTNTAYRIPFALTSTGSAALGSDQGFNYNPSIDTLNVSNITADSLSVGAGVWLIDGTNTGSLNAIVPLFTSQSDLGDINNQSALSFPRQDNTRGSAGDYQDPFNNDNKIDTIIVFPKWGIVGFNGTDMSGTININYKNTNAFPTFVDPLDNVMSSCKIYLNDVEQT